MDHAPHRIAPKQPQEVLPSSQYLQERLQERRARNTRPKRSRQSDFGPQSTSGRDDDIFFAERPEGKQAAQRFYDSSPLAPFSKHGHEAGDVVASKIRTPGARQLDEQFDRLTKQNFDLKLEIDHRRAQQAKLKSQIESMRFAVERAEQLAEEHAELLRINSELVEELEKRDKAMQEAVDIICDLEEKIEDLEDERHSVTRPSTAQADSGYAGTETHEQAPPSSPPEIARATKTTSTKHPPSIAAAAASKDLNKILSAESPARGKREPLFLSQRKGSTNALRSVYLGNGKELHPVKSFNSILSRHTSTIDGDSPSEGVLNSPRLSVLSESSFPSIYSPKKISPEKHAWEPDDNGSTAPVSHLGSHTRQDSIKRVSRWMEDHEEETPTKSNNVTTSLADRSARSISPPRPSTTTTHLQSLDDALSKAALREADDLSILLGHEAHSTRSSGSKRGSRTPTSFGGPIFGEPLLPPTPESASTHMLRSSRSAIIDERSLLDTTPANLKGFNALEPDLRTAPKQMRSSMELKSAYASNLEHRKTGLSNVQIVDDDAESASSDEDDTYMASREFRENYLGYPDGNSILMGTPSRFLKHSKPPAADMFFDANDLSSPEAVRQPRRRKSSSEAAARTRKPSLGRAGTSPTILSSLKTMIGSGTKSPTNGEVTSPISYYSTSSSNRTVLGQQEPRNATLSPDANAAQRPSTSKRTGRVSASPARPTLTQKTQLLFRRLSSSHGSDRDREHRDRQLSPSPTRPTLPTLTSTPSSAYVNVIPKEARRGNASQAGEGARPPSSSEQSRSASALKSRPAMQSRTKTEPMDVRRSSASDPDKERRNVFQRRGSLKASPGLDRSKTVAGSSGGKGTSVKDIIAPGRRAWR